MISDRVMAIDIKFKSKWIRICPIYLPHSGKSWDEFQNHFASLTILVSDTQKSAMILIIGDDVNFQLGEGDRGSFFDDF